MAGFHVGVRGNAAGRVVRCGAKPGGCRLTGADGEPTPHFSSLSEGEAFLAEREAAQRGGFTAGAGGGEAKAPALTECGDSSGLAVDAARRIGRSRDSEAAAIRWVKGRLAKTRYARFVSRM